MTRKSISTRDKKKASDKIMKSVEPAPSEAFMQRDTDTPLVNKFQVNMILEVADPRNLSAICIATVIETLGPLINLHLDGEFDGLNDFWKVIDSEDINPVGTAQRNGQLLQPPLGYTKKFSTWHNYITKRKENAVKAGEECFPEKPEKPPKNLFQIGQKLEAADKKNSWYIFPATVGDVQDDLIYVTFDGWRGSMDYWCKYSSRDIFPMGWCKANGFCCQPAGERGDNPKVAENIKEALENRKRRTRSTKLQSGTSGGLASAQNKGLTSTVRDKPIQQRRSITKTANSSSPIVTNISTSISNQRLRSLQQPSVETTTSSTAKLQVKNNSPLPSKSPITTTPITSPADFIKQSADPPASLVAVSNANQVVVDQDNNKADSSTPITDITDKETAVEETKKEAVEEVESEKDSSMKSKKSNSVKSSPKKSPNKKTPATTVKSNEDNNTEDKQLDDDDVVEVSDITNDNVVTDNTKVEEEEDKPSEPMIVVSENETDDIQTDTIEEMQVESQPQIDDLVPAKGETIIEVPDMDDVVVVDSVSTSEKTKNNGDKSTDDKTTEIKKKIETTSNNKSTTDTGGEDDVTEGSDSSSSQKKSKKKNASTTSSAAPKSEMKVRKQIKKAERYARKLEKQQRRVAKLQKMQNSDGSTTAVVSVGSNDVPDVTPSPLIASTTGRKRTISDADSIKSGHKKKKKKKKIPKTNEKQASSIQALRHPPALFGDGSPTQPQSSSYKQIQNPILRSPTSGWPSRLTMNSPFNMVTSDNKLGRFDMTSSSTSTTTTNNGTKVDNISHSPVKQITPMDNNKSQQQQEVDTSADTNKTTTNEQQQNPTTTTTKLDKQVSKVDSTADNNIVDNNDAVSSTTSPPTEAPQASTPIKSPTPQTTIIAAETPQVAPITATTTNVMKNIADTTTISSPRILIKPPSPNISVVETSTVKSVDDSTTTTTTHCEKVRRSRNPKRWTISQVCDYLVERDPKFETIVHSFPKHEIDGAALLLIDSVNVKYLKLKLGPELKLVSIVGQLNQMLEERRQRIESTSSRTTQ